MICRDCAKAADRKDMRLHCKTDHCTCAHRLWSENNRMRITVDIVPGRNAQCPKCRRTVATYPNGNIVKHKNKPRGWWCEGSKRPATVREWIIGDE